MYGPTSTLTKMITNTYYYPHPDISNCIEILISDDKLEEFGTTPHALKQWCQHNTRSFVWMDEVDTSDVSVLYDSVYAFYFVDQQDANWFSLRWSS